MQGMREGWVYRRGDIYVANLNPVKGSEQGGTRPVVILQNDDGKALLGGAEGSGDPGKTGAADDHVNGAVPLGGSGGCVLGSHCGGGDGSGNAGSGGRAKQMTARDVIGHDLLPLELAILDRVAIVADEVALLVHGMALRAVDAAHVRVVRIELVALGLGGKGFIRTVALQTGLLSRSARHGLAGVTGVALQGCVGALRRHGPLCLGSPAEGRGAGGEDHRQCFAA